MGLARWRRRLCLGVLGFGVGVGVLATFSLPLRRQPAADLSQAFRILAVSLVPTPRLVLAFAPFVQAGPRGGGISGFGTVLSFNVVVAHGRFDLPRERPGENVTAFSPGAIKTIACKSTVFSENKTETKTVLEKRSEKDARIETRSGGSHQKLVTGSHSSRGIIGRNSEILAFPYTVVSGTGAYTGAKGSGLLEETGQSTDLFSFISPNLMTTFSLHTIRSA